MRRIIILFAVMLLASTSVHAQELQIPEMQVAPAGTGISAQGLSSTSAFLLAELTLRHTDTKTLCERYRLVGEGDAISVNAFVQLKSGVDIRQLESYEVTVKGCVGNTLSILVPLARYADLATSGLCELIDIGSPEHLVINQARASNRINTLYNGSGVDRRYNGSGVVVGVVDNGFEYGHPAFYDSTGTTLRVKRVWNQKATSGTPPTGYTYGAEYTTTSSILAAQTDIATMSHGTHVTGIAAGCGGNNATGATYRGVAPAADIVLVTTTLASSATFDGIKYIVDYAQSVGKPCVINLSLGSHVGPHDGTSTFDRLCDTMLSTRRGVVLVGAAGNEGEDSLHISKTFTATDTNLYTMLDFEGSQAGSGIIDIWGAPGKRFMAGVGIVDGNGRFVSTTYLYYSHTSSSSTTNLSGAVDITIYQSGPSSYNNRQSVSFVIDATALPSGYRTVVIVRGSEPQVLHMWGEGCTFINGGYSSVTAGNTDYTVGETGGTGNSMLTVGSYVTRNTWQALNGTIPNTRTVIGTLSYFSSHGPTLDGRVKPDVVAPGEWIVAPINRFNTSYTGSVYAVARTSFNGNTEYYGAMQGTSMATPFVTGVVALWLQNNNNLSYADAKRIAHNTALSDSHTGTIPSTGSNLYGWGKINAIGNIPYTPTAVYNVNVTVNKSSYGSVNNVNGSHNEGDALTLTATATSGHHFLYWSDDHSSANPRTLIVTSDTTFTAVFAVDDRGTLNSSCVVGTTTYETHFDEDNDCWILQDMNNDGATWRFTYDYGVDQTICAAVVGARNSNEYLASPFIQQAGRYTVTWKARGFQSGTPEVYGLYAYDGDDNPCIFSETLNNINYVSRSANFVVRSGEPMRMLFVYTSDNKSGMLLDDVCITRTGDAGIDDMSDDGISVYTRDGRLVVEGTTDEVRVFDVMGRRIRRFVAGSTDGESLPIGVYMVQVGSRPARKVVVLQ
jgi:subtilisin family serine protease